MLSFGIQSAEAKCFGNGASWPNKEVSSPRAKLVIAFERCC
jgi:hypothetical protein